MSLSASGPARDQFAVGLAALVLHDSNVDVSADNLNAVLNASGLKLAPYWAPLYASFVEKAGGVDKFFTSPGAGGAAAAPGTLSGICI